MKKLILCAIISALATGTVIANTNPSMTSSVTATSTNCPPGKMNCNVSSSANASASSRCFNTPGIDATKNMNATLEKLGYGHPSSIAVRSVYQILVQDSSDKQKTLFFDFDTDTGNLVGQGTVNN